MAKKVIRLTEIELSNLIKEATRTVINEMDGATYSRIYNASHKAKEDNQNGNHSTLRIINNKTDELNSYNRLADMGYDHKICNHGSLQFVIDGEDMFNKSVGLIVTWSELKLCKVA
jgi:hypothetical protein